MKKIIFGLCFALIAVFAYSQNGLENIIVEKYYISNAADAAGSVGTLPVGSVTYRIYADMLPGYKFQAAYGIPTPLHELRLETSTSFFNNEDRGATTPTYTKTQAKANTVMLDSWLSVGGACTGNFGIMKSEDDGVNNVVNSNSILQNNNALAGIPLTTQDGLIAGSPESVTFVGLSTSDLSVFDATSQAGNLFSSTNGSWASLNGSTGPSATNRVLIAQITTDGVFHYELNIQIGTPSGGTENYVAKNPVGNEISIASLMGTLGTNNVLPTISITSPLSGTHFITNDMVTITANAADADGTVTSVEFFVDGNSAGLVTTPPYSGVWTATSGNHTLSAVATDNDGGQKTSAPVTIIVGNNQPPTVSITAPADGSSAKVASSVNISANASDIDGTVSKVEFYVNNVKIGEVFSSPYQTSWTAVSGTAHIKAVATDNLGAQTTSTQITVYGVNNLPPSVSITAPINGAAYLLGNSVIINANANDADGTVSKVEFFVNGSKVGESTSAPYTNTWTSTVGTIILTAKATDNDGGQTTSSPVTINVSDPNALPYAVGTVKSKCVNFGDCIPVIAIDTVKDCIGFDIDINYDPNKVVPTGYVTIGSDLINPQYVSYSANIIAAQNKIKVSVYLNSNAPTGTTYHGKGTLFCTDFAKNGNFGSSDTAVFSVSSLMESYNQGVLTKLVENGKYISYKDSLFNGSLRFWADNSPIVYNQANPNDHLITNIYGDNTALKVQPDINGEFVYNINNGPAVNIDRDILSTTDVMPVVNGQDALYAKKVLVDDLSFVPNIFQMISLDVNMDGVVSAGDLSQMNQRTILSIAEFKQAWNYDNHGVSNGEPSKDWLFLGSSDLNKDSYKISLTYPENDGIGYSKYRVPILSKYDTLPIQNYSSCPIINGETYMGVLLGDVNGNYKNIASNGLLKSNNGNDVIFDLSNTIAGQGYIDVPVSVSSANNVNALDFSMQFNEQKLTYQSVIDLAGNIDPLAYYNVNDHTLRFTSSSIVNYKNNVPVVSVRFTTDSKNLISNDFKSINAYVNGDPANVKFESSAEGINEYSRVNTVKVYPNPASTTLNVISSENADVQLMNINGQQILQFKVNANQNHELNVKNLSNGVYMMKIFNDKHVSVQRVIINK